MGSLVSWPAYRPMPRTCTDQHNSVEYKQGALTRAAHRTLMAIRWRNPELRDEDKSKRRLPTDWHDWMNCPGSDSSNKPNGGYKTAACSCDQWLTPRAKTVRSPRSQVDDERKLRERLKRELSSVERMPGQDGPILLQPVVTSWVKTIDSGTLPPSVRRHAAAAVSHSRPRASSRKSGTDRSPSASQALSVQSRPPASAGGRWDGRKNHSRLGAGARVRVPPWVAGRGRLLSGVRAPGGRVKPVAEGQKHEVG